MSLGTLALFERSLRVDARTLEPHIARFSMIVAIYLIVVYLVSTIPIFGASGLRFVAGIAYLDVVFVSLMGISIFSSVITEEKENGMLDLILLSGITPLRILLAKSVGQLIQVLLLIAVQYPFTAFSVTLGGVTQEQVRALYVALFAYALMLMGVGLACSMLSRLHRSASILVMFVVAVYWAVPHFCDQALLNRRTSVSAYETVLTIGANTSIFLRIGDILATGFHDSVWSYQVVSNLLIGTIGFFVSWTFFGNAAIELTTEATRRGWVSHSRGLLRYFSPGRAWANPLVWKDFFFVVGGFPAVLTRFAVFLLLYPIVARVVMSIIFGGSWPPEAENITTQFYLVTTTVAIFADAGNLVARSFYVEIQAQTLGTLRLSPMSSGRILYSKVVGLLLALVPGILCLLLGVAVLPFGTSSFALALTAFGYNSWMAAHLFLIPHAAAAWAIFGRRKALALALFTMVCSMVLTGFLIAIVGWNQNGQMNWLAGLPVLGFCGFCQYAVWRQTERQ